MSSRLALLLSSALISGALASPALARQADTTRVDEVVITGSQVRLPPAYAGDQVAKGARVGLLGALDTMDTPFAVTSYTEALIRNQQARSVADVLQNDPTVRVTKGFGNFQELYVVRGFPVYSDDMTYNGLYGVLPRQFVAAELIERVDVFRGANAFLNGAAPGGSGVGGAFNLMPKRAPTAPLTRFTAGWDGGEQVYGSADIARRFGQNDAYGARVNLGLRGGETAVDGEKRDLTVLGLGLDRRGDRARFSADLGWQDHRIEGARPTVTPLGAIPKAPSADKNFAQPWTHTDERQLFGAARGEFDLTDTVSAWAALGGRQGKEDNVLANPTALANGTLSAYRFDNVRKDSILSTDAGLRAKFTTGAVGHALVASVAQVNLKSKNAYAFSNFAGFASNLYNPVAVAAPNPNFFVGGSKSDPNVTERVKNRSVAVADTLSFLNERLLVTVGVRYQDIQTRSYDYNTGARNGAYDGDATTPALAAVFKPSDKIDLAVRQLRRGPGPREDRPGPGQRRGGGQCRRDPVAVPRRADRDRRQVRRRDLRRFDQPVPHHPAGRVLRSLQPSLHRRRRAGEPGRRTDRLRPAGSGPAPPGRRHLAGRPDQPRPVGHPAGQDPDRRSGVPGQSEPGMGRRHARGSDPGRPRGPHRFAAGQHRQHRVA